MEHIKLEMEGLVIIKPDIYEDHRGFYQESYNQKNLQQIGITDQWKQDSHSFSHRGTLRGLHAQKLNPQAKLVRVVSGEIFDVQVDIRPGSKTFGQWNGVFLSAENRFQVYIPKGFLHGFVVVSENADVLYKSSEYYHPEDEMTVNWTDPDLGIKWPRTVDWVSDKDKNAKTLKEQM